MKLGLRTTPRPRTPLNQQAGAVAPNKIYDFSPGSDVRVRKHVIGHEMHPVLVVDGLLRDPASAVAFGAEQVRYVPGPEMTYFPGTRGCGSDAYVETFVEQLGPIVRETFALRHNVRFTFDNMFSLTTTPGSALRPLQKIPHFDIVGPRLIAVVHFLFDQPLGGTGFFRHKATGWESISEERAERYGRLTQHELEESGAPGGYLLDESPYFERTFNVEPAMDRMVIFSGHLLHSATIPDGVHLPHDPYRGRLTINSFISLS